MLSIKLYTSYLINFNFIKSLIIIFIVDSLLIDDEPLWEPLEWSLVQTWLLFLFFFTWVSEVIFSSRYGSYSNRDKKVWIGLYKTYWLFQLWFMFNLFVVTVFVTLPFYFELTYSISYIILWWNWYNSIFFFKWISVFSIILCLINYIHLSIRWFNIKYIYIFIYIIFFFFLFFSFFFFFFLFFSFFSDINEYDNNSWSFFFKIINSFNRWNWGLSSRDHFSYHRTTTIFWFKNDPLIASSMFFINLFIFFSLFFLKLQLLVTLRLIYTTKKITFNFITMLFSSIKQFFLFFLFFLFFIYISVIYNLIRFPFEFYWFNKVYLILNLFVTLILDFSLHIFN